MWSTAGRKVDGSMQCYGVCAKLGLSTSDTHRRLTVSDVLAAGGSESEREVHLSTVLGGAADHAHAAGGVHAIRIKTLSRLQRRRKSQEMGL